MLARFTVLIALSSALGLVGCDDTSETEAAEVAAITVPEVSVDEAAQLIEAGTATAIDANSQTTRESQGTLPGARLLTSSSSFDVAAELPADHDDTLVFYCANENCSASDAAAQRAAAAGFEDVRVMRAGIQGWKAAGKATDPVS